MTYHRAPLSGLGSHGHPPWGPEGGAWWKKDNGWAPNIQGPWYAGGSNLPSGELILQTIPSPQDPQVQQALQFSRQALEVAQAAQAAEAQPLWIKALNWVKDHPFIAGGALIVVAMAAQRHGMITNRRRNIRTRRSPRNQSVLFRALFQPSQSGESLTVERTAEEIDALPISKTSKSLMKRDAVTAKFKALQREMRKKGY